MEMNKTHIGIAVGAIVIISIFLFIVLFVIFRMTPNSGTFAGFGEKGYRSLGPGIDVHPIVEFYYKNRELRKKIQEGTAQIEAIYITYKSFVNADGLDQVPTEIMKYAMTAVSFMEQGGDFSIPDTPEFRRLGMFIVNMDRTIVSYLDSLKFSKSKVGGTDPNQERVYNDYIKVGSVKSGIADNMIENLEIDKFFGDDTRKAEEFKDTMREQIGLQLQMGQSDPLRYAENDFSYQENLNSNMKGMSAGEKYRDKRFPGTYERRQISDGPIRPLEKNYRDPNVPRLGIIGRTADVPYEYDVHAKNFVRSY